MLARAVAEGHELANHSTIDELVAGLSQEDFETKFRHCHRLISKLQPGFHNRPFRWFRPGGGAWTPRMLRFIEDMGYTAVLTNVYPILELPLPRLGLSSFGAWLTAIFMRYRARPGSILLVHDRWHTPATLRNALPYITAQYDVGTVSQLFE